MDPILLAVIGIVPAIVTGVIGYAIAMRKIPSDIKVASSLEKQNLAAAVDTAAGTLVKVLEFAQQERLSLETRIENLELHREKRTTEINELRALDAERLHQIKEQQRKIEELNARVASDIKETIRLQDQVTEMETKYNRMRRVNEKLVRALNDAKIPLPDMNGDLTDSVRDLKFPK